MHAIISLILAAGTVISNPLPSASVDFKTIAVPTSASIDEDIATFDAPDSGGTLERLSLAVTESGTGAGTMEISATAAGVAICTLSVACAAAPGTEATPVQCDGAVSSGAHLDVQVTAEGCITQPAGNLTMRFSWQ